MWAGREAPDVHLSRIELALLFAVLTIKDHLRLKYSKRPMICFLDLIHFCFLDLIHFHSPAIILYDIPQQTGRLPQPRKEATPGSLKPSFLIGCEGVRLNGALERLISGLQILKHLLAFLHFFTISSPTIVAVAVSLSGVERILISRTAPGCV